MHAEQDILTGIDFVRHKIEHLETKVDEIHAILEYLLLIIPPVTFTMPDGSQRLFRPNRPVSRQTLDTMARVEEMSQVRRHLSSEERTKVFLQAIERARAEAIRKGIAIDDEREAAVGD
jgi:hypothetical protein